MFSSPLCSLIIDQIYRCDSLLSICSHCFSITDIIPLSRNYKQLTIIVALSSVSCVAVIISLSYFLYRKVCLPPRPKLPEPPDNSDMYLVKSPSTPSFELEQLKFEEVISRGRYGEVWHCMYQWFYGRMMIKVCWVGVITSVIIYSNRFSITTGCSYIIKL